MTFMPGPLGREVVAELVQEDHDHERHDDDQDGPAARTGRGRRGRRPAPTSREDAGDVDPPASWSARRAAPSASSAGISSVVGRCGSACGRGGDGRSTISRAQPCGPGGRRRSRRRPMSAFRPSCRASAALSDVGDGRPRRCGRRGRRRRPPRWRRSARPGRSRRPGRPRRPGRGRGRRRGRAARSRAGRASAQSMRAERASPTRSG